MTPTALAWATFGVIRVVLLTIGCRDGREKVRSVPMNDPESKATARTDRTAAAHTHQQKPPAGFLHMAVTNRHDPVV